jgi:phage gp36-like protein
VAYCSADDIIDAYGETQLDGWSNLDSDRVARAITDASAEIDGYLYSGGYAVPLVGTPPTIKKYCIDIACANLVISAGVLEEDSGGKAVIEQAKIGRAFLMKVAEGKFKIPGYSIGADGEAVADGQPAGNIQVHTSRKLDWWGY